MLGIWACLDVIADEDPVVAPPGAISYPLFSCLAAAKFLGLPALAEKCMAEVSPSPLQFLPLASAATRRSICESHISQITHLNSHTGRLRRRSGS